MFHHLRSSLITFRQSLQGGVPVDRVYASLREMGFCFDRQGLERKSGTGISAAALKREIGKRERLCIDLCEEIVWMTHHIYVIHSPETGEWRLDSHTRFDPFEEVGGPQLEDPDVLDSYALYRLERALRQAIKTGDRSGFDILAPECGAMMEMRRERVQKENLRKMGYV